MEVTSTNTALAQPTAAAEPAEAASQNEFLKLFVAQLKNQDPLSPQDGADFVAQLAQFSSLEQATESNERLAAIEAGQSANLRTQFTDLVGRTVTAANDKLSLPNSDEHGIQLDSNVDSLTVDIVDGAGQTVRTIDYGSQVAGDIQLKFDGRDNSGALLPDGDYRIRVTATRGETPVAAVPFVRGVIDSLAFAGGQVNFRLGSSELTPGDIIKVES